MVRILALQKAELILVPTALPYTEPNVSIRIIPAMAMQNRLFIAYCNLPLPAPCEWRILLWPLLCGRTRWQSLGGAHGVER